MSPATQTTLSRKTFIRTIAGAGAISCFSSHLMLAQTSNRVQTILDSFCSWAERLFRTYNSWGESIDREKFASALTQLDQAVFGYCLSKQRFLQDLANTLSDTELKRQLSDLSQALRQISQTMDVLLPMLATHPEISGADVAQALNLLTHEQNLYIEDFPARNPKDRRETIAEGQDILDKMLDAARSLSRTLEKLRSQ